MEGNLFAYTILAVWPLVAVCLYRTQSIQVATLWTIVGGFMFLPVRTAYDFPMIPSMDKQTMPVIAALIGCWFMKKQHISYFKELGRIKYLVILLFFVPFISAILNNDALVIGGTYFTAMDYYDGLSNVLRMFLLVSAFFIGRQLFRTYDEQLIMFKFLVVVGLLYSLPILFEIRMSPQLHQWVYGYFPHSFAQQVRDGGYRAVVFMGHGLLTSFFMTVVLLSSVALWRCRVKIRQFPLSIISYYCLLVLVLCKSLGAMIYGVVALFFIKFIKPKIQHKIAIAIVFVVFLYPALSILKIFPHQKILDVAYSISAERGESLQFRFDNEKILLDRALERPFFGWGGWGRARVFDNYTGKDISITDGTWVIAIGNYGVLGFIAEFGLLGIAVFRANSASKLIKSKSESTLLAAHALLVAIILLDQIPNSSLSPWLWLLVGALLGRSNDVILNHRAPQSVN